MKTHKLVGLAILAVLIVGCIFGVRYLNGSWAPASFEGGLYLSDIPELRDSSGALLSSEDNAEFKRLCSKLRSTTRHIGKEREQSSTFIRLRYPKTNETDILTISRRKNVVFKLRWIDTELFSMTDRRAPCYELSSEFKRFIKAHELDTNDAEQLDAVDHSHGRS